MKTRNLIAGLLTGIMTAAALAGCSETAAPSQSESDSKASGFNGDSEITVLSRENGSGTRGAFIELMGIEEKSDDGTTVDNTTDEAVIANKTDVMLTNVSGDKYGIGYVSLGSLSSDVKAVKVDGIEATAENIKNNTYKAARPFNIAAKAEISDAAKDFVSYILSEEGQEIVSDGYIKVNDSADPYTGTKPSGKIVVAGSSSVSPVMEKLKEAYLKVNTNAEIELQTSDSTAGMTGAMEGTCDIGMASRDLKDSEKAVLTATPIAIDGIAIIVNPENPIENITSADIKDIFTGAKTKWSEVE